MRHGGISRGSRAYGPLTLDSWRVAKLVAGQHARGGAVADVLSSAAAFLSLSYKLRFEGNAFRTVSRNDFSAASLFEDLEVIGRRANLLAGVNAAAVRSGLLISDTRTSRLQP